MTEKKAVHITPDGLQGGWRVEVVGTGDSESFSTREAAEARAKELAGDAEGDSKVLVHDEGGHIDDEWTEGESTSSP